MDIIRPDADWNKNSGKIISPQGDFDRRLSVVRQLALNCASLQDAYVAPNGKLLPGVDLPGPGKQMMHCGLSVQCHRGRHEMSSPVVACGHVIRYDAENLKGIIKVPWQAYFCRTCFRLLEKRSFRLKVDETCAVTCLDCVLDKINAVRKLDPTRYRDLALES